MRSILDDVTYSATKAYSYRGGIIDAQAITSLTESSDLDELVTKLKATPYDASVYKSTYSSNSVSDLPSALPLRIILRFRAICLR